MLSIHRKPIARRAAGLLALLLVLCLLAGCQSSDLSSVFAKSDINGVTISYMGYTGDDIPSTELTAEDETLASVLDALYTAEPVTLDLSQAQSYSPEMNASHILYLHTAQGSMPLYMDSYHGIFSVPMMRNEQDQQVRTYMTFQPLFNEDGSASPLWQLLTDLEPVRVEPQSVLENSAQPSASAASSQVDLSGFVPPDDSALRAQVDQALISSSGETILFESGSNDYAAETPLYYAFDSASLSGVAEGRVYIAACPEASSSQLASIASITKVMTLLLAFEAVHDGRLTMETPVPVSEHAYHMGGSQIWLEPGEHFTLDEMIKAICVSSANDAAVAVAELVGGSEPAFVEQMNARAASLGMEQTSFRNACGLDTEGHLSTARDVAVMSRTILNTCPEVLHYTGIWTDTLRGGATQLVNTNKLLRRYEGITGLKTGTTGGAGICISASATRNGLSLIAVILGAPSSADRFNAATTLLDYGFGAYEAAPLPKLEAQPLQITVRGSAAGSVPLDYSALPETVLVEKGSGASLHTELTLPEELEAPVEQGQTLGKAAVYQGEELLEEYEVRAAADAPRMTVRDAIGLLWQSLTGAA